MDHLKLAIKAAQAAGKIHRRYFRKEYRVRAKSTSFDLLSVADTTAEKAVVRLIKKYYPGHNFLAEEYRYAPTPSEYTWVIDPLDGTNNFISGMPIFCSSVALVHQGKTVAAAIYDPLRDELFYAQKNKGAYLNRRRIRVNQVSSFKRALLITGFYYDRGKEMVRTLETMKRFLLKRIIGIRRLGAAALDLCYVACGRAAGFWEFELSPWDFCAGKLIIEEAAGKVSGKYGECVPWDKKHFIVASNGRMHSKMLQVIRR